MLDYLRRLVRRTGMGDDELADLESKFWTNEPNRLRDEASQLVAEVRRLKELAASAKLQLEHVRSLFGLDGSELGHAIQHAEADLDD